MSESPPVLLAINGPAGVGKSTLAARLAAARPASAHVFGDDLKRFIVHAPANGPGGMTYRTGGRVCGELLDSGYQLVVFDFVFNNAAAVERFWSGVRTAGAYRGYMVTLWAQPQTLAARRSKRVEDPDYSELMDASHNMLAGQLADLGTIVHTDNSTPGQVERQVLNLLATSG